jgi:biopolymer transport protein ExbB/TolQ
VAGNLAKYDEVQLEMPLSNWRLRIYTAGFLVSLLLYFAVHGVSQWRVAAILMLGALLIGVFTGFRRWLRLGVTITTLFVLLFPVVEEAAGNSEPLASVVSKVPVWPQLLVTLIASRLLAIECELSFTEFWRQPIRQRSSVEFQSFSAAVALGSFLMLTFYLIVPHLFQSARQPQSILVSAMLGGTVIHSLIIFLFFVILSLILDAANVYARDRSVLFAFRRWAKAEKAKVGRPDPRSFVMAKLASGEYSRAVQFINSASQRAENVSADSKQLIALAFDCFHQASRQFVRTLLPFLPLLGFLGTVVGLATAMGELPRNAGGEAFRSFDVSASLAGLAIKFETTLLGLIASMTASFSLNLLEKRESELAAECILAVDAAGRQDA